jgi:hypothetical protein
VKKIVQADGAIVVWWTTPVECYSAFARRRRDDILTRAHEDQARHAVARLAADWTEVQPSRQVRETAARVLLLHPLRATDALQLAAGLLWADGRAAGQHFVCFDERLREAAQREGFEVLP